MKRTGLLLLGMVLSMAGGVRAAEAPVEKPLTESPFGVVGVPTTDTGWKLFREARVKWVVMQLNWAYAEPEQGKFSAYFDEREKFARQARDHGAKTLFYIGFSPLWANQGKIGSYVRAAGEKSTENYPFDDDHREAFKSFLRRTFQRLLPLGVDTYETWAEEDGSMFKLWDTPWYPKFEAYQRYASAMREVADEPAFKGKIHIIGDGEVFQAGYAAEEGSEKYLEMAVARATSLGGSGKVEEYVKANQTEEYYKRSPQGPYAGKSFKGLGRLHDAIALHAYWTEWPGLRNRIAVYPPEMPDPFAAQGADLNLAQYIEAISHRYGGRRVWITEAGYQSGGGAEPQQLWVGREKQAEYLVRYFVMALGTDKVDAVFWNCWRDNDSGSIHGYGLIDKDDNIKPAYLAYRTMAEALEGKQIEWRSINQRFFNEPEQYVYCFSDRKDPKKRTYVLWQPGEGPARLTMDAKYGMGMNCYGLDGKPRQMKIEGDKAVISVQAGEVVFVYAGPEQK